MFAVLWSNLRSNLRSKRSSSLSTLRNSKGMTLIEILIVMGLVAGLIAVLYSQVFGGRERALVKETKIRMSKIQNALELYRTDCQKYPGADGLGALMTKPADCKNWGPEAYAKDSELKDSWGNDIVYEGQGSTYTLKSLGKDGVEGGEGYNSDITSEDL